MRGKRGAEEGEKASNWLLIVLVLAVVVGIFWLIMSGNLSNLLNYASSTSVDSFVDACNLKKTAWTNDYCCSVKLVRFGGSVNKQMTCWSALQSASLPKIEQVTFSCNVESECKDFLCPKDASVVTKCSATQQVNSNAKFYFDKTTSNWLPIQQGIYCCVNKIPTCEPTYKKCASDKCPGEQVVANNAFSDIDTNTQVCCAVDCLA